MVTLKAEPAANEPCIKSVEPATLSLSERFIRTIGWLSGFYSRKQTLQRSAKAVYLTCAEQGAHQEFYRICQMVFFFFFFFLFLFFVGTVFFLF